MYTEAELDKGKIKEEFLAKPTIVRDKAIADLPSWAKTKTLAELHGELHTPSVMVAFAQLANNLAGEWAAQPENFRQDTRVHVDRYKIIRDATRTELIDRIVQDIWNERYNANTKESLQQAKAEFQATVRGDDQWSVPTTNPKYVAEPEPLA